MEQAWRRTPHGEYLATIRRNDLATLQCRLDRAVDQGELPQDSDTATVAAFYSAVSHGMAIHARDGASRELLEGIVDMAMATWETRTSPRAVSQAG